MVTCKTCGSNNEMQLAACRICGTKLVKSASEQNRTDAVAANVVVAPINGFSKRLQSGMLRAAILASWGAGGGLVGEIIYQLAPVHLIPFLSDTFAFAVAGCGIAAAITIAQAVYLKRRWLDVGTCLSGVFGLAAGAVSGAIANLAYNLAGANDITRVLAWGLVGLLIGLGLSFRISNLDHLRSVAAGLIGGLLGGVFEVTDSHVGLGLLSLFSCSAIGFLIALMIVVGDTVFREAWLEIQYGPRESRTVSLGKQPVCVGSSANDCAIYVRGISAISRRYEFIDRRVVVTDISSGRRTWPAIDEAEVIGNVTLIVRGSE